MVIRHHALVALLYVMAAAAVAAGVGRVSAVPSPAPAPSGGSCVCDAGDYWCAVDGHLRRNFNCSGSPDGHALWDKLNDDPTDTDCLALATICEAQPPAKPSNASCDDDCYDFCWLTDVGDCADMDDEQTFCVSMCQDYCLAARCGARPLLTCEASCGGQFMSDDINFVDYSMCVAANCTAVPIGPYSAAGRHHQRAHGGAVVGGGLGHPHQHQ
jgi:hypothetical protein